MPKSRLSKFVFLFLISLLDNLFYSFYLFIYFNWRLITLQYCGGFCHTFTWISHGCTYVPHPDPPSHFPPHPIPQGHCNAPALSTLPHTSDLDWWSISHTIMCMFHCYSLKSSPDKAMAPHSSTLALKIPCMEEPGRLQFMGSLQVGYDWATSHSLFTFLDWRRKWQPTPVFLPGESQGRRSLAGCHLWGHTELDTTEAT